MPAKSTTTRATHAPTPTPPNGGRKPNGGGNGPKPRSTTRNGGAGKPATAWPVSLILAAEVEIAIEGEDTSIDGFSVCTRCAAVLPGSEISRGLHARHHELIDALDQRIG